MKSWIVVTGSCLLALIWMTPLLSAGEAVSGDYLETRTCDVYTGPCFANAEVGQAGQEAVMAWSIEKGSHEGVDLSGLKVVLAVRGSDTLGFGGGLTINPEPIRSVVLVDEKASASQRDALVQFAKYHAGPVAGEVVRVKHLPIEMSLDHEEMVGKLQAGREVAITTRKLMHSDCVCTNEMRFYPPLADINDSEPAYTVSGKFSGRGLQGQWSNPDTRSSYLGTFYYDN
jgi:hypothetical protein